MNYLEKLAEANWSEWRMLPVEDTKEPIRMTKSRLNITSEELDKLAEAVESLAEKYHESDDEKTLRTIAKKCWTYLKEQSEADPIHPHHLPYFPPLVKCIRVYETNYPKTETTIPIICQNGTVYVAKVYSKIFNRESALVRSSDILDISKLDITTTTLKRLISDLCKEKLNINDLSLDEYFDLLIAASLLEMNNLRVLYLNEKNAIENTKWKDATEALRNKVADLKNIEENIFDREQLLQTFSSLIWHQSFSSLTQYLISTREYRQSILNLVPLKSFSIGFATTDPPCASFGPEMLSIGQAGSLETLDITCWEITEAGMTALLSHKNLRSLSFSHCRFMNDALKILAQFPNLQSLRINTPKKEAGREASIFSEEIFKIFGQITSLKTLDLYRGGEVRDDWLQHLNGLKLETLKLNRIPSFTGIGLKHLDPEKLQCLELDVLWDLTEEGVQEIPRFSSLTDLTINIFPSKSGERKKIEQEVVQILPKLSLLTKLNISHRDHLSALKVYTHLPSSIQEVYHSIQGNKCRAWSPATITSRGILLNKWQTNVGYPTFADVEKTKHALTIRDWTLDYLQKCYEYLGY